MMLIGYIICNRLGMLVNEYIPNTTTTTVTSSSSNKNKYIEHCLMPNVTVHVKCPSCIKWNYKNDKNLYLLNCLLTAYMIWIYMS